MSDDTLNVDPDQTGLPTDETIETDGAASQETTAESTDKGGLKGKDKALADTEAAIKERQAEFTRLSQQLAEMKGQLTTLTQIQSQQAKPVEQKDWMEDLDGDKFVQDPITVLKTIIANQRREIAAVLQDRDAYLLGKVGSPRLDPEVQSKVDELKSDPVFADLPTEKLAAIAAKMIPAKKAVMQPRGNIAAGSRGAPVTVVKDGEYTPEQLAWLKASGAMKSNKRDDTLE